MNDGDHIAESQAAQPELPPNSGIKELNIEIAAYGIGPADTRSHDGCRDKVRHRHSQSAALRLQAPSPYQSWRRACHKNGWEVEETKAQAARVDLHSISDLQTPKYGGWEIDEGMFDAAMLSGDDSSLSTAGSSDDNCKVTDARVGQQRKVRTISGADHFSVVVVQCHTGFDMVSSESHTAISNPAVHGDSPGAGQDS